MPPVSLIIPGTAEQVTQATSRRDLMSDFNHLLSCRDREFAARSSNY